MPDRIIKASIWTSPNLNALTPPAERHFYRLLPLPDDHGCFESTPAVVKGLCYPLRADVRANDIARWNDELAKQGICAFWTQDGREYGIFTNWEKHQRIRSLHKRKTPPPPESLLPTVDDSCRQLPTADALNPNPNPNLNPVPPIIPPQGEKRVSAAFDAFWKAYPKKVGKRGAEKAWKKIRGVDAQTILDALNLQLKHRHFRGNDGTDFVPNPATWLNQGRWEDEVKTAGGSRKDDLPPELRT